MNNIIHNYFSSAIPDSDVDALLPFSGKTVFIQLADAESLGSGLYVFKVKVSIHDHSDSHFRRGETTVISLVNHDSALYDLREDEETRDEAIAKIIKLVLGSEIGQSQLEFVYDLHEEMQAIYAQSHD